MTMTNAEIKNIAIKEVMRGFESAYNAIAEYDKMSIEDAVKTSNFIYEMQQSFLDKYVR